MWYMIEGFNGYEINEQGVVRSMKMMKANPGHQIKLYDEGYYILSDNKNRRVKRTPQELLDIVFNSGNPLVERPEHAIYLGSRNKRFYFDEGIYPKDENTHVMDFSKFIVKDE